MNCKGFLHIEKNSGIIFYRELVPAINSYTNTKMLKNDWPTVAGGYLLEYEIPCDGFESKHESEEHTRGHIQTFAHNMSLALGPKYSVRGLV
jgi:hypothetical protein